MCFLCEVVNVWNNMSEQVMSIFAIHFKVEAIVLFFVRLAYGFRILQFALFCNWVCYELHAMYWITRTIEDHIFSSILMSSVWVRFRPKIQNFHICWPASAELGELIFVCAHSIDLNLLPAVDCSVRCPRTAFNRAVCGRTCSDHAITAPTNGANTNDELRLETNADDEWRE